MSGQTNVIIETEKTERIDRVYYSTHEVAEFLEIPPRTIREWIRRFNLKVQRNTKNCVRLTMKDIESLKFINKLINVDKYSFEGVALQLKNQKDKK